MREDWRELSDKCPNCGRVGTETNPVTKQYTRGQFRGVSCAECVRDGKHEANEVVLGHDDIIDKIRRVLALTHSTNEGEAQNAMAKLQDMLVEHNLTIAEIESRGAKKKADIKRKEFDLGKAAFKWKLDLASTIADHYFCVPLVDSRTKTVEFLGRPENVESLHMLYDWIMDQIKAISKTEREKHQRETGEHIDPLRWQINFGQGAVNRLYYRLEDIRRQMSSTVTALVISHRSEISDWAEEALGRRFDGQMTKAQRESHERWLARERELEELKKTDIEAYYQRCPWDRPEKIEQRKKEEKKLQEKWAKQERRRREREWSNPRTKKVDHAKVRQARTAADAGYEAGENINIQPFLKK